MTIHHIKTKSGKSVSFDSEMKAGQGGRKVVYFAPDKSYVLAFYKERLDPNDKNRIERIINQFSEAIFEAEGGAFWKEVLCWMTDSFEYEGRDGIVLPVIPSQFFFELGSFKNDSLGIKGCVKRNDFFTQPQYHFKYLDEKERGNNWQKYLRICLCIARGVGRLHKSGLAHGDLSFNNVLADPVSGKAHIIDMDEIIVPNMFLPTIIGTRNYYAPEVLATQSLKKNDPKRKEPSIFTDLHALAVLIYQLLLYRHPLEGKKCHDPDDPDLDDKLRMGAKALFIEHPTDESNRPSLKRVSADYLPWADVRQVPYTITGPYLTNLFNQAFVTGLHLPHQRPSAAEWEIGLIRTMDLLVPCLNSSCNQKTYIYDTTKKQNQCPFCGKTHSGSVPVLEFYSCKKGSSEYKPENVHMVVHHNKWAYLWHVNKNIFPNEKLTTSQKKPVGYFSFHQGRWVFVNQTLENMMEIEEGTGEKRTVPINSMLELKDGQRILFSPEYDDMNHPSSCVAMEFCTKSFHVGAAFFTP